MNDCTRTALLACLLPATLLACASAPQSNCNSDSPGHIGASTLPQTWGSHAYRCGQYTVSFDLDKGSNTVFHVHAPKLSLRYFGDASEPVIDTDIQVPLLLPDGSLTGKWESAGLRYPYAVRPRPNLPSGRCRQHCKIVFKPLVSLPAKLLVQTYLKEHYPVAGFRVGGYTTVVRELGNHPAYPYYLAYNNDTITSAPAGDKVIPLPLGEADLRRLLCRTGLMPKRQSQDCRRTL